MCIRDRFGTGQIFTLKKAKERFLSGDLKPKNAEALTEFSEFSNVMRSADKAYEIYCKEDGAKETHKLLNKFNYVDTSFVTIPNRDAKLFGGECVPVSYTHLDVYKRQHQS